jgi:hypothetical protein
MDATFLTSKVNHSGPVSEVGFLPIFAAESARYPAFMQFKWRGAMKLAWYK